MTIAALALAVAVLIVPGSSRRRAEVLMGLTWRRRQFRVMPLAVIACAALPWLMPWTTTVGLGLLAATLLARRRLAVRRKARIGEAFALQTALDVYSDFYDKNFGKHLEAVPSLKIFLTGIVEGIRQGTGEAVAATACTSATNATAVKALERPSLEDLTLR